MKVNSLFGKGEYEQIAFPKTATILRGGFKKFSGGAREREGFPLLAILPFSM